MDAAVRAGRYPSNPCRADGEHSGRELKVARLPRWIVKTAAVVMPLMRELDEMLYQWEEPFVVDDRRFRERFQRCPKMSTRPLGNTMKWALQHYVTSSGSSDSPPR